MLLHSTDGHAKGMKFDLLSRTHACNMFPFYLALQKTCNAWKKLETHLATWLFDLTRIMHVLTWVLETHLSWRRLLGIYLSLSFKDVRKIPLVVLRDNCFPSAWSNSGLRYILCNLMLKFVFFTSGFFAFEMDCCPFLPLLVRRSKDVKLD